MSKATSDLRSVPGGGFCGTYPQVRRRNGRRYHSRATREHKPIDSVTLTVPNARPFYGVVRMLVGGLAARLDLAYEKMDDLQLAVESILLSRAVQGDTITLRAEVDEGQLQLWVGPLDGASLSDLLADTDDRFGLERVLYALVEEAELVDQDDGSWVRLEQANERSGG